LLKSTPPQKYGCEPPAGPSKTTCHGIPSTPHGIEVPPTMRPDTVDQKISS